MDINFKNAFEYKVIYVFILVLIFTWKYTLYFLSFYNHFNILLDNRYNKNITEMERKIASSGLSKIQI